MANEQQPPFTVIRPDTGGLPVHAAPETQGAIGVHLGLTLGLPVSGQSETIADAEQAKPNPVPGAPSVQVQTPQGAPAAENTEPAQSRTAPKPGGKE